MKQFLQATFRHGTAQRDNFPLGSRLRTKAKSEIDNNIALVYMTQLPFLWSNWAAGSYHILAGGANSSLENFFTFFLFPVTFSQSGELSCPCLRVDGGGVAPWRDKNINDDGSFRCNPT